MRPGLEELFPRVRRSAFRQTDDIPEELDWRARYNTSRLDHHVSCPGCYPPDTPDRILSLCGKPIEPGPRYRFGAECLTCVTLLGQICERCGT